MDRSAVFVDAGYVLAEGGSLCCATKKRSQVVCDHAALIVNILKTVVQHGGLPVLRLYWYDGARNAIPTLDHLRIAHLPNVKLRLGRLSGQHQKGVDALIFRDLMTLARERAMAMAYIVGGDEDLREGIVAAQDMGVRVVLLGIPTAQPNQSQTLIQEADDHLMPAPTFWSPYFSRAMTAAQTPAPVAASVAPVPAPAAPALAPAPPTPAAPAPPASAWIPLAQTRPSPTTVVSSADPFQAGVEFALAWGGQATPDEIRELLAQAPRIPVTLDVQLLREAEGTLGPLRERQDLKRNLRAGFWQTIRKAATITSSGAIPGRSSGGQESS